MTIVKSGSLALILLVNSADCIPFFSNLFDYGLAEIEVTADDDVPLPALPPASEEEDSDEDDYLYYSSDEDEEIELVIPMMDPLMMFGGQNMAGLFAAMEQGMQQRGCHGLNCMPPLDSFGGPPVPEHFIEVDETFDVLDQEGHKIGEGVRSQLIMVPENEWEG